MRAMSTAIHQPVDARAILTEDLLRKFDTPGPRYTSYPTADRFTEKFGPAHAVRVLGAGRAIRRRRSRYTCTSPSAKLVAFEAGVIQVTAAGWFLVRAIAMVFDHHLQVAKGRRGFSRVV